MLRPSLFDLGESLPRKCNTVLPQITRFQGRFPRRTSSFRNRPTPTPAPADCEELLHSQFQLESEEQLASSHTDADRNPRSNLRSGGFRLVAQLNRRGTRSHTGDVRLAVFRPSRVKLEVVTAGEDRKLLLWNAARAKVLRALVGHEDVVTDACFSVDGVHLVTSSLDGTVRVWDVARGVLEEGATVHESSAVRSISVMGEYQRMCCATSDGAIGLWDTASNAKLGSIEPDRDWAARVRGELGAGVSASAGLLPYDPQRSHAGAIAAIAMSPNGRYLLSASQDGTCKLWNILSLRKTQAAVHAASSAAAALAEAETDRSRVLAADSLGQGSTAAPHEVGFHGSLLRTFPHDAPCCVVTFNVQSTVAITGALDSTLKMWSCRTGEQLYQVNLPSPPTSLWAAPAWWNTKEESLVLVSVEHRFVTMSLKLPPDVDELPPLSFLTKAQSTTSIVTDPVVLRARLLESGIRSSDLLRVVAQQPRSVRRRLLNVIIGSTLSPEAEARLRVNLQQFRITPSQVLRLIAATPIYSHEQVLNLLAVQSGRDILIDKLLRHGTADRILNQRGSPPLNADQGELEVLSLDPNNAELLAILVGSAAEPAPEPKASSRFPPIGPISPRKGARASGRLYRGRAPVPASESDAGRMTTTTRRKRASPASKFMSFVSGQTTPRWYREPHGAPARASHSPPGSRLMHNQPVPLRDILRTLDATRKRQAHLHPQPPRARAPRRRRPRRRRTSWHQPPGRRKKRTDGELAITARGL